MAEVCEIQNLARRDGYSIRWQLTSLCNYACDFCIQGSREAHLAAAKGESAETRRRICDALVRFMETELEDFSRVFLYLGGGEVSILSDFPELLGRLLSCRFRGAIEVRITTNLSMPAELYAGLCCLFRETYPGPRSLSISASFYKTYTTMEAFSGKARDIARRAGIGGKLQTRLLSRLPGRAPLPVRFTIGYPILSDGDHRDYLRWKKRLRNRFTVSPILIREYDVSLSEEVEARLRAPAEQGIRVRFAGGDTRTYSGMQQLGYDLGHSFRPEGYLCDAGVTGISVEPGGRVLRCPVLGGPEGMVLGDLLKDPVFSRLREAMPCAADHCSCNHFGSITLPEA